MIAPWERFTAEQRRAALLVGQPVMAAAGAGAGKTAVMAVRYCACLLERGGGGIGSGNGSGDDELTSPDRVLALAFTREAAGNLRARVDRTLRTVIALGRFPRAGADGVVDADLAPDQLEHLRRCLARLAGAPITTFDGLCLQLASEHAAELGRDPDLAPPEALAWAQCTEAAWSRLRRAELGRGGGALARVARIHGENVVRALVTALAGTAAALPVPALAARGGDPLAQLFALRTSQLAALRGALAVARSHSRGAKSAVAEKVLAIPDEPDPGDALAFCEWIAALDAIPATCSGQLKEAVRALQDALDAPHGRDQDGKRPPRERRATRGSLGSLGAWRPQDEEALRARAGDIAELATLMHGLIGEAAEAVGIAGFARVEAEALRLLSDPRVRARLGHRYRHVLLDEAQDLNRLQGRIIELLRSGGATSDGARIFAVGDHRQSIFGFRHADPDVFAGWERTIVDHGGSVADLAENFRSHPQLVESVKAVFAQPSLAAHFRPEAIRPGLKDAPGEPLLACWLAVAEDAAGPVAPRRGSMIASEAQARLAAHLIGESIGAGRAPGDHALLMRSRSRMRVYAEALERASIAYDTDFPGGLYDSQECHDVESILRLCLCPHDRFALAVALGGPWGGDDPQDRRLMVRALELEPDQGWQLARSSTPLGVLIDRVRPVLAAEGMAAAVRMLACDQHLARRYGRLPLARRRLANLARLASEEDSAGRALDPHALLARLVERRRLGIDAAEASGEEVGGKGVRLMTIHGSKGLEWPVVFLADLDKTFGMRDLRAPALAIACEDGIELACRPESGSATIGLRAALAQDELHGRILAEEARLFYVACTRAKLELHCLAGAVAPAGPLADGAVACPGDWLTGAGLDWTPEPVRIDATEARARGPGAGSAPLPDLAANAVGEIQVIGATRSLQSDGDADDDAATPPDLASAVNRDLGIAIHEALARFGPGMSALQAESALAPFRAQVAQARLSLLAAHLCDKELIPGYWQAAMRLVEQPVIAVDESMDGGLIHGICDLLLKDTAGAWHLYDYKSGGAAARANGARQVQLYARMLAAHLDGPLASAWLVDVELARLERVDLLDLPA